MRWLSNALGSFHTYNCSLAELLQACKAPAKRRNYIYMNHFLSTCRPRQYDLHQQNTSSNESYWKKCTVSTFDHICSQGSDWQWASIRIGIFFSAATKRKEIAWYQASNKPLSEPLMTKRPVAQIPQCTCPRLTMHHFVTEMCTCAHFCYKMLHCGIFIWCFVGFVSRPNFLTLITVQIITVWLFLPHWGRVTHICVNKLTIIGSDNGLSPSRRQAITWTNVGILLIGPLGTNFSEMLIEIFTFSFKKMRLKMSPAIWRSFCLGLNVLSALG